MRWISCLLFLCSALGGCGGSGLRATLIDSSVQKPSNVAVYFTLDTADGEPVPGLPADRFRIYEDDRLVSIHESKQTIINPEVAVEQFTLLLVDMSGSVVESGDVFRIIEAASSFAEKVGKSQKVAVFAFDGRKDIYRLSDFSNNPDALRRGVQKLDGFDNKDPSTNLNGAVLKALDHLDRGLSRSSMPIRFGTLVIFTDGSDRANRVSKEQLYETLENNEHDIMVIGVGAEIDDDELEAIGKSGAILTKDREEVASAFEDAAARIEALSKRYYLLGYCSPSRAGIHRVRIEADYEGQSGGLTHEFSADGFRAPCDSDKKPSFSLRRPKQPAPRDEGESSGRSRW